MKFALFYEIPVTPPFTREKEHAAFQNTLEQAVRADELGWHGFWTVEHHFLEEFSHCSNPEVLYGAVAARTQNLRIGYGVRLAPKPYNHPIRSAESAAVLDHLSKGRVDFGTGRSSTRLELEGFGIHPDDTRGQWREALDHIVGAWTNEFHELEGEHWQVPRRRVIPKPYQDPHPPIFAATGSESGHRMMGELGLGLCSFSVGTPPEDVARRIDIYREALKTCDQPVGATINPQANAFTMVNCAPTRQQSYDISKPSFEWYPKRSVELVTSVAAWLQEMEQDLGTYDYLAEPRAVVDQGLHEALGFDYLHDSKAVLCGDPDEVTRAAKEYEAAGVDLLLCLINPWNISHEDCMQTIELMGKHVIPEFAS